MEINTSSTSLEGLINFPELIKELSEFDYVNSLYVIQYYSAKLLNQTAANINIEFDFHGSNKVKHSMLLTRDCISFLAKQVIIHSNSGCKKKLSFTNWLNFIGNYLSLKTDLSTINPESEDSWLWVLRMTNLQWFYLRAPVEIISRYYYIFFHLLEMDQEIGIKINNLIGLQIIDIFKIGFSIYTMFNQQKNNQEIFFQKENLLASTAPLLKDSLTAEKIDAYLKIFCISKNKFIEASKKLEIHDDDLKIYEFNPLRRYPIVETESLTNEYKYIFPSLPDFTYSFSEGLYYVLIDLFDQYEKNLFFKRIGFIFEKYIGELLKYYHIDLLSNSKIKSEITHKFKGGERKSADWLLVGDEYIFQIECKKRKLNSWSKMGIDFQGNGISSFVTDLAKQLDKLIEKGKHIRNDLVSELEQYKDQKIINIIVYLDEMFSFNEYARAAINKKMINKNSDFYILGCYEFEILCQICRNKNIDLNQALKNFDYYSTGIYSIDFLSEIWRLFQKKLIKGKTNE